jgi:hypothetical protein
MFHLTFILISFVLPSHLVLFLSFVLMLPIYTAEFVLMYGSRIPVVKDLEFFSKYGKAFSPYMRFPVLEQFLYFIILTLFFMTISCFKLSYEINQKQSMKNFLITKIEDRTNPNQMFWNFLFFVLKYI